MPKWQRAPQELVDRFAQAVQDLPSIEPRKMFGYPAVFLHGNMFAGLFQDTVIVRLGEQDRAAFAAAGAAPFEPMGRPMREYMTAPHAVVESPRQLRAWIERARDLAAALPAKAGRKRAKPAPASKRPR